MPHIAIKCLQDLKLLHRFDAFGNNTQSERVTQPDDRSKDRRFLPLREAEKPLAKPVVEHSSVRYSGERIGSCLTAKIAIRLRAFTDVPDGGDDCAGALIRSGAALISARKPVKSM